MRQAVSIKVRHTSATSSVGVLGEWELPVQSYLQLTRGRRELAPWQSPSSTSIEANSTFWGSGLGGWGLSHLELYEFESRRFGELGLLVGVESPPKV